MITVATLLRQVVEGRLIAQLTIPDDDVDALLDRRDEDAFSLRWMMAYESVERGKEAIAKDPDDEHLILKIRESSFLQIFERWSSLDLASYVSDDFGLIADALVAKFRDLWIDGLLQDYLRGQIPGGDVAKASEDLPEQGD